MIGSDAAARFILPSLNSSICALSNQKEGLKTPFKSFKNPNKSSNNIVAFLRAPLVSQGPHECSNYVLCSLRHPHALSELLTLWFSLIQNVVHPFMGKQGRR